MVCKDDYCYFPITGANPGAEVSPGMGMTDPGCARESGGTTTGHTIQALCQTYLVTGYEPALNLAGKLAVYLKNRSRCYDPKGRFTGMVHTHMHLRALSGLLQYAVVTNNREMLEFCRRSYEYAKTTGNPTVGFFASMPGPDTPLNYATLQENFDFEMEGCSASDMVAVAIKLSRAGVADYWDDADRYIRNQFAEIQIMKSDWVYRMIESLPPTPVDTAKFWTADRVAERHVGAVLGITNPNDFSTRPPWYGGLYACCTSNYSRAIPYIWDNILGFEKGTLRVNLLLNRVSPWADVESYIPYEGRVDIKVKKPCKLSVRIPEWVKPEETVCNLNGQARELGWDGRYAQVREVKAGDVVALTFPISERTVKESMVGVDFTLIIKGNTVVFIDPPGEHHPFYQRAHYRENRVRWVKRPRFVLSNPSPHWLY